jgi:hypothetical protein
MEEEHCGNNWDLHAVVRFGCRRALSSTPPPRDDPFAPFLPPPTPVKEQPADAGWCFPDLGAGFGQDADELLKAFCAASPPTQLPLPPPTTPPPPPPQQQQQEMMAPAEVLLQTAAPAPRAQPSGRQASGGVPRSKRRYAYRVNFGTKMAKISPSIYVC